MPPAGVAGVGAARVSPSEDEEEEPEQAPKEGDIIEVMKTFGSDNKTSVNLEASKTGVVVQIDEDGDAEISFDGMQCTQWVVKENFGKIKIIRQAITKGAKVRVKVQFTSSDESYEKLEVGLQGSGDDDRCRDDDDDGCGGGEYDDEDKHEHEDDDNDN